MSRDGFGSDRRAGDGTPSDAAPRRTMPGHGHALIGYVTCHGHRKNAYHARKDARAVRRVMARVWRDKNIEIYPCDLLEGMWHIGHPPRRSDTPEEGQ